MKNRVRVATNKARRFLFNSGELQKNKEKVIIHSKIEVWLKRQTSIIFLFAHKNTPYHKTRGEIIVIYSDILNFARITSSVQ